MLVYRGWGQFTITEWVLPAPSTPGPASPPDSTSGVNSGGGEGGLMERLVMLAAVEKICKLIGKKSANRVLTIVNCLLACVE
jgi:hypothetical protein